MIKKIVSLLRLADLKEEEVRIYLLLMKLQRATISELVGKSGFNSMMVYRTIKRLLDRSLVGSKKLNNKQNLYCPLSLENLVKKIDKEERKLFRLKNSLMNLDLLLPYIDFNEDKDEEMIEVKDGVENFRAEYLKFPDICNEEYLHVGSMQNYWKTANLSYDAPEERGFIHKRLSKDIYARCLNTYSKEAEEFYLRDSLEKRTTILKRELPVMKNYLAIAETQSALFLCDEKNPRVIVVKQPELLALHKAQFAALWDRG